ncbi:MAG TPA: GntR family transcriptional regulator [Ktedonobacteraceae bacterium]|nr:GntR family transcriptional regulator [Ktedonobacteraceae bacterium]
MHKRDQIWENAPTRRDAVVERLRQDIITGALRPGAVLKDAELASQLGLSITPVREALTQLAAEGLIEMPPNRPKRVAPLTRRRTRELLAIFRVLALAGYEWGFPRLSEHDREEMHAANEALATAFSQGDTYAAHRASRMFSDIVMRASGNRELRRMLASSFSWLERLAMLCFQENFADLGFETNREILAAVERGDLCGALTYARNSLDQLQRAVEALPEDMWSD